MPLTRTQLKSVAGSAEFVWATGIEDTFIVEPHPTTGRTLDEYELTGHYDRWRGDLALMTQLGVGSARYGLPWHRVQPAPQSWDWRFADGPLRLLGDIGIEPIVDLVHYAAPGWIAGSFVDPQYPAHVAQWASRTAERYLPGVRCYTPLNEPRITAQYCGRLGWWPPHLHGDRGFLAVMLGVCRGISETVAALRRLDPEIAVVHVDATDLYEAETPDAAEDAQLRQELVFLALDLILGRFDRAHPLWAWARRSGGDERALLWFSDHPVEIDVCGINLYPMFSLKKVRREKGRVRVRMPYADASIVARLVRLYSERYGLPMMVTETASRGPGTARRERWLKESVEQVRICRRAGLPVLGYTWWPMFALVAWAYRQGSRPASAYLEQMGLFDLGGADGLERLETPLVAMFRELAAAGMPSLARPPGTATSLAGAHVGAPIGA